MAYLDFSKALDTDAYLQLLHGLKLYGISQNLQNSLSNTKQCVLVNGALSEWGEVSVGISQGSAFGHILFIFYLNDSSDVIDIL